jgi:isocitrate lyase
MTTPTGHEADNRIRTFQRDGREAGRHLPPPDHAADLSHRRAAPTISPRNISATKGMLGYVAGVQRKEIRQGIACVKHQNMSGSTSATITRNISPAKPR